MLTTLDRALREELHALNGMAKDVLAKVDRPTVIGIDPDLPAGKLARMLLARMGPRRAAILRTKLHTLVWVETRARWNGRNGHGA
jgi:hypothetical protein